MYGLGLGGLELDEDRFGGGIADLGGLGPERRPRPDLASGQRDHHEGDGPDDTKGPATSRGLNVPGPLPSGAVIRLDAATVLLQWAVGGMAFCWFTTRRRVASLGYGWLLRGVYAVIAAGAFACGLAFGVVPVREAASLGVAISCLVVLGVSVVRRRAGVSGHRADHDRRSARVAAMTGHRPPGRCRIGRADRRGSFRRCSTSCRCRSASSG